MGWDNDYEVSDVKIVRDLSYETIKRDFDEDVKRLGLRRAIENVAEHIDVFGQVNKAIGTSAFLIECDMAFVALMDLSRVAGLGTATCYMLKYKYSYGSEKRTEWGPGCKEDMISENKACLKSWIRGDRGKLCEELCERDKILLRCKGNKSFFELFLNELENMTALYCKQTGKEMKAMRKNIYTTAYDYLDKCEIEERDGGGADYWIGKMVVNTLIGGQGIVSGILDAVANNPRVKKTELALNASKIERMSRPYTYFMDAIV